MAIEKTLVLVKPDGVERNLIGEIIATFERAQIRVADIKMVQANEELLDNHYQSTPEWINGLGEKTLNSYKELGFDIMSDLGTENPAEIGKQVKKWLVDYMMSSKVVAMVLEGNNAIKNVRHIVGFTIPCDADAGSIRGRFSSDSPDLANKELRAIKNLVHASGNKEEAEHEINLWFN